MCRKRNPKHSQQLSFRQGVPPTEVAHLAGWENVQTVHKYSVPSLQQKEETSDIQRL